MKAIRAKQSFRLNGKYYIENDEIQIENYTDLIRLNQKGYISPLTPEEMKKYKRRIEKMIKKLESEEEKIDGK